MIAHIAIILVALVSSSESFQKLLLTRLVLRPSSASVACAPLSMSTTKVERNQNFAKLQAGYLFPEIARRRRAYLEQNPSAKIISLGKYSCIDVM
jgi:hypothetical protein